MSGSQRWSVLWVFFLAVTRFAMLFAEYANHGGRLRVPFLASTIYRREQNRHDSNPLLLWRNSANDNWCTVPWNGTHKIWRCTDKSDFNCCTCYAICSRTILLPFDSASSSSRSTKVSNQCGLPFLSEGLCCSRGGRSSCLLTGRPPIMKGAELQKYSEMDQRNA